MRVISLGWGVQSFGLAAMSALGVLPRVDVAIHADTTHERSETYAFAKRWTPWLEERGVRVVTVNDTGAANKILEENHQTYAPVFSLKNSNGKRGQLRRSCTQRWKIAPMRRWLQKNRNGQHVEQWIGFTLDEAERVNPSDVGYVTNVFPFLDMLDPKWTRGMVMLWLQENGLEIPVKSACVFCPFHNRAIWRDINLSGNGDWQKALEVDDVIRHKRPGYACYLTPERKPLIDCDFSNQQDHGQLELWSEECSGMCFL